MNGQGKWSLFFIIQINKYLNMLSNSGLLISLFLIRKGGFWYHSGLYVTRKSLWHGSNIVEILNIYSPEFFVQHWVNQIFRLKNIHLNCIVNLSSTTISLRTKHTSLRLVIPLILKYSKYKKISLCHLVKYPLNALSFILWFIIPV